MTHTPGPWTTKAVHGLPDEEFTAVIGGDVEICILPPSGEANARLIAAAPDLLEALKSVLETITKNQFATKYLTTAQKQKARAAIALATQEAV